MFELPESLEGLSREELVTLRDAAVSEAREIDARGEKLPKKDLDRLDALLDAVVDIDAATEALPADEIADDEAAAASRSRLAALDAPADEVEGDGDESEDADESADEHVDADDKEPVLASGRKRSTAALAKRKAPAPKTEPKPEPAKFGGLTIVAAAGVPDHVQGEKLDDMDQVAKAFLAKTAGFGGDNAWMGDRKPGVYKRQKGADVSGVAKLRKPEREGLVLDPRSQSAEQQFDLIMDAAKESRLPQGNLVAAGGWCAPSEQIWGFCELETTEGLLDIPELTARRGGISFTKGPDFGTLFADVDFGFIQTEAQAIAGDEKPCYAIECPPWQEVRLDAVGFCITAPILTNAAYPELVRRVLNLAGVGQARRINASTINRISALIGGAANFVEVGAAGSTSGVSDTLDAVALQALRIRQTNAMSPNATIEGIAPHWLREYFRSDMSRRNNGGLENLALTDAQVDAWFAVRGVRLQYVYDYQMLTAAAQGTGAGTTTWTTLPNQVEIMLYPAGAFVRLTNDVINLNTVYDHDLLTQNTYTAAFFEEGMAVANTCGGGVKVAIQLNNEGATGYPAIGAGAGISFAPAV